jgi:outer membrane protein
MALAHAPAVKAAEAQRDASTEDVALGRAGLLPNIELNGTYALRKQNTAYDVPQSFFKTNLTYGENFIGVKLVQSLFDLERWAGYRQGQLSAEAGELKLQMERQRLMLEVAQAFLDTVTAQSALAAAQAREAAAAKLAIQAETSFRVGMAAKPEQLDAESRRDLARADRLQAENNLNQSKASLASLIGEPVGELALPQLSDTPADPSPDQPGYWENQAAAHALAVKLAEIQFGMAKEDKQKSLGGALPKVEAFAEINRNRATDSILNSGTTARDQAVGVEVKVPLYAGGGITAQMRKSEKQAVRAEFDLADDVRLARLTARQSFLAMQAARAQMAAMQQATLSTRQDALATHTGYHVGLRSITEVLDADERTFTAETNLAVAKSQYIFAILQLKASIGALTGNPLPSVFGEAP